MCEATNQICKHAQYMMRNSISPSAAKTTHAYTHACMSCLPDASSGVMVPGGKESRRSLRLRAIFLFSLALELLC